MADRRAFEDKYCDLWERWDIKKDIVNYIIRRYTKILKTEGEALENDKFKLPKYFKDRRTDEDYLYDLIDGWLIEDIVCDAWLRARLIDINPNIEVKHMGTNRDRSVQKFDPRKISTEPDFIYSLNKHEIGIELQMARKEISAGYDMKTSKVTRAIKNGHLFLWIIIPKDMYFICDPHVDLKGVKPFSNPLWGGKMVYRLTQEKIMDIGYSHMKDPLNEKYYTKLAL